MLCAFIGEIPWAPALVATQQRFKIGYRPDMRSPTHTGKVAYLVGIDTLVILKVW